MKDTEMSKAYDAQATEDRIYQEWMDSGAFSPEQLPNASERTETFSIVLPPPNVTGTLHLGHAVMLAIEDAMVRFARMRGKRALWIPGTDHAAIATESKVEKLLIENESKTRHDLGREAFLARVNAFAQESHDTIVNQMKKMGASVDWSREAYTLDDARNLAVRTAFKRMYDDGLIYRGHRVVNWDPLGQTSVSDDEVEYKEGTATLYTFKYAEDFPMAISTTRPETKVGDTAVAVHPEDPRYVEFIGKEFEVDFAGAHLTIRVVGDAKVDPEFGTGALGVTPAHSVIDSEIAKDHGLPIVQVIGEDGRMRKEAGTLVAGQTTLEARETVIDWLKKEGLLEGEQEVSQNLSIAQRSGGVIEPLPKEQWFVDVNKEFAFRQSDTNPMEGLENGEMVTLKKLMSHAVKSEQVKILPERFEKTYFHWIDNLRDWNISRQLWFGHRIPVWYRGEEIYVGVEDPEGDGWVQDEDTLDTWFSSGLWTFSTLGWPNESSEDLRAFHPTEVLETGYDILFFWVARMILMSTYLLGEVPFKTVYLHGLVRDAEGRKMSKSLGNVMNPLDTIRDYGADATRLSLMIGSSPGNDTKLSEEKIASYRNFTNKLWNISRFVFMNVENVEIVTHVAPETLAERWILGRLSEVITQVTAHMEAYEFSLAGELLRDFTWNEFADWYIEIAKSENSDKKSDVLLYVLRQLLKLWHPFMPFVTEEIYRQFNDGMLMVADWPVAEFALSEEDAQTFETTQQVITSIRNMRAMYRLDPKKKLTAILVAPTAFEAQAEVMKALARLDRLVIDPQAAKPEGAASSVVGSVQVYVPLTGVVDLEAEKTRMAQELQETSRYKDNLEKRLNNPQYVEQAPEHVVQSTREELEKTKERVRILEEEIENLA